MQQSIWVPHKPLNPRPLSMEVLDGTAEHSEDGFAAGTLDAAAATCGGSAACAALSLRLKPSARYFVPTWYTA